jgi:hypothetical protein
MRAGYKTSKSQLELVCYLYDYWIILDELLIKLRE